MVKSNLFISIWLYCPVGFIVNFEKRKFMLCLRNCVFMQDLYLTSCSSSIGKATTWVTYCMCAAVMFQTQQHSQVRKWLLAGLPRADPSSERLAFLAQKLSDTVLFFHGIFPPHISTVPAVWYQVTFNLCRVLRVHVLKPGLSPRLWAQWQSHVRAPLHGAYQHYDRGKTGAKAGTALLSCVRNIPTACCKQSVQVSP